MLEVKRKRNEDIDRLMRRFKTAYDKSGIRHELKKHEYFQKPSKIRNVKNADVEFLKKKNREREEQEKLKRKHRKRRGFTTMQKRKTFQKGKVVRRPQR